MKVTDRLGNELKPGDVVYFAPLQTIAVVMDIEEPGKVSNSPGNLTLGIKSPIIFDKPGQTVAIFADMMRVHTPDEGTNVESQVNDILTRNAPKRPLQLAKGR